MNVQRFWSKVYKTDGCWLWLGYVQPNGYAQFRVGKKRQYVHRVAYELVKGSIPDGLQIDHLCAVRKCVNPDHLEAVTPLVNNLRCGCYESAAKIKRAATTCHKGHTFTPDNTMLNEKGHRSCKTCHREKSRKSMEKLRLKRRHARGLPEH